MHTINYKHMPTNIEYEMLIKVLQRAKEDIEDVCQWNKLVTNFKDVPNENANQQSKLEEEGRFKRGIFNRNI
jgi:hypothetical protein